MAQLSQAEVHRRGFRVLLLFVAVGLAFSLPVLAQEDPTGSVPSAKSAAPVLVEDVVLPHFHATSAEITDEGRVRLVYDFSTKDIDLLADWTPAMKDTKRRIRWSQGYEGTWTTVEDGLIIADRGTFLHTAEWDGDVELSVDFLSMSSSDRKDLLSTIYVWDKGKKVVGSQVGRQCLKLSKTLAPKGRPIPAEPLSQLAVEDRVTFGMRMRDGVISAMQSGRVTASSAEDEKFVEEPGPGQAGLAWNGRVNGFVFRIVIEGRLSAEWVSKHIPGGLAMQGEKTED